MHVQVVAGGADSLSQCVGHCTHAFELGGLLIGGALMTRDAAHWGSWADCLEMIAQKHPLLAQAMVNGVGTASGCFRFRWSGDPHTASFVFGRSPTVVQKFHGEQGRVALAVSN